jgi:P4 family phage/plasmid primase-like protien
MIKINTTIYDILNKNYKSESEKYSHLSFIGGKWLIANDFLDAFYVKYFTRLGKEKMHLIEKINKKENFKLFFDLEVPKNIFNINFNTKTENFLKLKEIIIKVISECFVNVDSSCLVTERVLTNNISKIHLNFPEIIVNSDVCKMLLVKIKDLIIFENVLNIYNLIDQSVYNTGLRLFGSEKSESEILKEIDVLKNQNLYDENIYSTKYSLNTNETLTLDLFKKLCIRLNDSADTKKISQLNSEFKEFVKTIIKDTKNVQNLNYKENLSGNVQEEIETVLTYIKENNENFADFDLQISKFSCAENANNFVCYFVVCLNEICPFKERKHKRISNPVYFELNKKGIFMKCFDSECQKCVFPNDNSTNWDILKDKVDITQLLSALKVKYIDVGIDISEKTRELLEPTIFRQTHFTIAKVAEKLYGKDYRVDNLKSTEWYYFNGIRFLKTEKMDEILSEDFVQNYEAMKICDTSKVSDLVDFIGKEDTKYNSLIDKLIYKLEDNTFKNKVKNQLATIIYNKDSDFYEKLNSNPYLLGFENGVYDLKNDEFRDGKQSDYLTFSTKNNYIPYDPENENVKEIYEFLGQIITNKNVLEYLLLILGRSLLGIPDEHFYIWTGKGSNSKSTLINFLEEALGDFAYSPDVSILTQPRKGSSNASPEIFKLKGKRLTAYSEPEAEDTLKVGRIKALTGNDSIISRELFKAPISFKSQASMFLLCNDLITINAMDFGSWRRIRVIDFKSKFLDNPDPNKENEFKRDPDLKNKIEKWTPYLMGILIHYYNKGKTNGIKEPEEVLQSTTKYKNSEDLYIGFMNKCLKITNDTSKFIKQTDAYNLFVDYWSENNSDKWVPKKKDIFNAISRTFDIEYTFNTELSENIYYGLTFK